MRFGLRTELQRRWTPKGVRPEGNTFIGYLWGYLYVALNPEQGQLQAWFMPDMQANTFQVFLDDFAADSQQSRILILDGAPSHKSKLSLPETVKLQLLPPYSPELNPVERLFQELRKTLSNKVFACIEEVENLLKTALDKYWREPESLIRLTFYPWMRPESNL